jgi:uncharacterized protein YqhQ
MGDELTINGKSFSYGGQAVIEGVLMRGAHTAAVACRNPKGQIVIHETPLNQQLYRGWIIKTPFLRGLVLLWDAMGLGTRALMWAADIALDEEGEDTPSFDGALGWGTITLSLLMAVGLFFMIPLFTSRGIEAGLSLVLANMSEASFLRHFLTNLLEGLVRLFMVVGYIWLIGRIPDVKRLFGYHGAEHKTINAYEAGAELTPEVVQTFPIEHPRCGTAFLLNVVVVSVLVFALVGDPGWIWLILSRIVLIPVVAGIAYEWLRWSAKHMHNPIVSILIKPNLALQHLTTNEPDLGMIETAIVSFKRVLLAESIITEADASIPEARPEYASPTFATQSAK